MDRALLSRVEEQAWFHRFPRGFPAMVLALTLAATVLSVLGIERSVSNAREAELDRNATELSAALQRRASETIVYLSAIAANLPSAQQVRPQLLTSLASDLEIGKQGNGATGLGWAPWLTPAEVPAFEQSMRAAGIADYHVWPAPSPASRAVVPVTYLIPAAAGSPTAIGYDMYSEAIRREAFDLAEKRMRPVLSGRIELVQDRGHPDRGAFLIVTPVFASGEGARPLKGMIYAPVRGSDFLASAIDLINARPEDIAIYDGAKSPERLIASRLEGGPDGPVIERKVTVGNRQWIIVVTDRTPRMLSPLAIITLLFGITLALLLMAVARLITRRAAEERLVLEQLSREAGIRTSLTRELNHRVKNTLANVLSIVALTRRRCETIDDFAEALTGRIRALSATHDLLSQSEWSNALIGDIVRSELAPYMDSFADHVDIAGPAVSLAPNDALSLGLAIHELATNAAKYGALSTHTGRVNVTWSMVTDRIAEITWKESGGPAVSLPKRRGFGLDLLEKIVANELKSRIDLRFDPAGVSCKLRVPVRVRHEFQLRAGDPPADAPAPEPPKS